MASVYTQDNEVLQNLWNQYNLQDQYMPKENLVEWVKKALQATNTLENFQKSQLDIDGLLRQFVSEIHQSNQQNDQILSLNYTEAIDFLRWLTNSDKEQDNIQHHQKHQQSANFQQHQKKQQSAEQQYQEDPELQQNKNTKKSTIQQQENSPENNSANLQFNIGNKLTIKMGLQKSNHSHLLSLDIQKSSQLIEKEKQFSKKAKTQGETEQNIDQQNMHQDQQINENTTNGPNQNSLQFISKKYKDYLRVIFQHYCKISYATGQDPTFEQIMHKTTIMTINKFMVFCKDFQISKISPLITRAYLIQIFKKNSECYKEMSFQQFIQALQKVANIAYALPNKEQKQNHDLLTEQMLKFLQFLQISTPTKFRQKMKRLNIQYRIGPKTNAELKVVPPGYRFKFTSNNGKSQQQIKQQIKQRKAVRSQKRLLLKQKNITNSNEHNLSLNKKNNQLKKNVVLSSQNGNVVNKQEGAHSEYILNKILTPPIPPARKMPPKPTSSNQSSSNPGYYITPSNNIQNSTSNRDMTKKDLGYAQLHKLKQSQGYSKRKISTNNSKSRDLKGAFKLNSIVEQARIQVMNNTPINSTNIENLSQSIATNSRELTQRIKSYDIGKINNKMQLINDKLNRDRQVQEQLNHLLDMSNDEQDQFLIQHLKRENKNDIVSKRISNKIIQLQYKK